MRPRAVIHSDNRPVIIWRAAILLGLLPVLLPIDPASPLTSPTLAGSFVDPMGISRRLYELLKAGILWVPLGALLGMLGQTRALRLVALVATPLLAAVGLILLAQPLTGDLFELLAIIPGLALGAWLGASGRASAVTTTGTTEARSAGQAGNPSPQDRPAAHDADQAHDASSSASGQHQPATEAATEAADPASAEDGEAGADKPSSRRHRHHRHRGSSPESLWVARLTAFVLLALAALGMAYFPLAPWPLALAATLYVALLWWKPEAWLLLLPLALPLLDLAPWSGRLLYDEFDLFMLLTLAAGLWRHRTGARIRVEPAFLLATGLFSLSYLISAGIGLLPPGPFDGNALNGYWSGYNSLRLAKGAFWAAAFAYLLYRNEREPHAALLRRFVPGMWLGLLGVCLIGLRERWQFSDLLDFTQTYRIVSTFSSMHTGGGYIEAYLVAAIPFLWLGLARWRLLLTAPLFALAVYITLSTLSRSGVLALAVALAILALGGWRQVATGRSGKTALIPPLLLLFAGGGMLIAGASGGYLQQRLAQTGEDWDTRLAHWRSAATIMDAGSQWFGMGLGRFPVTYLYRNPEGRALATYNFASESGNGLLRLGHGETLYMAQRVDVRAGGTYLLSMDLRGTGGKLDTPLCEKQLLNSRACVWLSLAFPAGNTWHHVEQRIDSGKVGQGNAWSRPPVELVLHNAGNEVVAVDNIQLLDANGVNLIRNGDFSRGGDFWFFKTHSHLPWHIKNLWVETLFNQGIFGLLALTLLLTLFLSRCIPALWRGQPLATVLTASLAGMLVVGMFDSLLDAPRIAMLFLGLTLLGSLRSVIAPQAKHRHHTHRHSHRPAA